MTSPTREQILRAYKALTDMCELVERRAGYRPTEYERAILAALPPKPRPTMADLEWDDDEHYLAEADTTLYGPVMMLEPIEDEPGVKFLCNDDGLFRLTWLTPERLTPTGRRYTLTEVQ